MGSFDFNVVRETTGELETVAWAEDNGWLVRKMQYPNRSGCPDRFFFKAGALVMMEFKKPAQGTKQAGKLRPSQVQEHARFREVGWQVYVVYTAEQAIKILKGQA